MADASATDGAGIAAERDVEAWWHELGESYESGAPVADGPPDGHAAPAANDTGRDARADSDSEDRKISLFDEKLGELEGLHEALREQLRALPGAASRAENDAPPADLADRLRAVLAEPSPSAQDEDSGAASLREENATLRSQIAELVSRTEARVSAAESRRDAAEKRADAASAEAARKSLLMDAAPSAEALALQTEYAREARAGQRAAAMELRGWRARALAAERELSENHSSAVKPSSRPAAAVKPRRCVGARSARPVGGRHTAARRRAAATGAPCVDADELFKADRAATAWRYLARELNLGEFGDETDDAMGAARSLVARVGSSQAAIDAVEASYVALRRRPARSEAAKAANGKAQYLAAEVADAVATEEACRALHAELRDALEVPSNPNLKF